MRDQRQNQLTLRCDDRQKFDFRVPEDICGIQKRDFRMHVQEIRLNAATMAEGTKAGAYHEAMTLSQKQMQP